MNLTFKEKAAYGLGAVGKDMVYMLSASYVLYYFQDILGVSAIAMGVILLVARIFDAFNDPIMGIIVAKTKTRWGKFRPWLLIGTITNAVILVLMFSAPPSLDGGGLVAYAAVTYILWGVTYTMMDIPYWSMIPAFTKGGKEREGLSALARSCAGVGSAVVTIITVMAVSAIGTAMVGRNNDNITRVYDTMDNKIAVYVVRLDDDSNATSDVSPFLNGFNEIAITLEGPEKVFKDKVVFTSDNTDYKFNINGVEPKTSKVEYVMDSADDLEAGLVFYVDSEAYEKITETGVLSGALTMTSNIEVERVGFKYFSMVIGVLFALFIFVFCAILLDFALFDFAFIKQKAFFFFGFSKNLFWQRLSSPAQETFGKR